ncbi:MAG: hypothetical protein AAGC45_06630 [Bacteroidota bacterium]
MKIVPYSVGIILGLILIILALLGIDYIFLGLIFSTPPGPYKGVVPNVASSGFLTKALPLLAMMFVGMFLIVFHAIKLIESKKLNK